MKQKWKKRVHSDLGTVKSPISWSKKTEVNQIWFPGWKVLGGITVQTLSWTRSLLPQGSSLACLWADKALLESHTRTVLTAASLIYQDYWHSQKQVVCLDETFPRQREKKKKESGSILPALGSSECHWFFSAGQKQWESHLQEARGMPRPPLPSPPHSTFISLHGECE